MTHMQSSLSPSTESTTPFQAFSTTEQVSNPAINTSTSLSIPHISTTFQKHPAFLLYIYNHVHIFLSS